MKRLIELLPLGAFALCLLYVLIEYANGPGGAEPPTAFQLAWIGTAATWSIGTTLLRPLTTPDRSPRDRMLVLSLLCGAFLVWVLWFCVDKDLGYWLTKVNGVALLAILGLVAAAVYIRMGWGPIRPLEDLRGMGRTFKRYLTMTVCVSAFIGLTVTVCGLFAIVIAAESQEPKPNPLKLFIGPDEFRQPSLADRLANAPYLDTRQPNPLTAPFNTRRADDLLTPGPSYPMTPGVLSTRQKMREEEARLPADAVPAAAVRDAADAWVLTPGVQHVD